MNLSLDFDYPETATRAEPMDFPGQPKGDPETFRTLARLGRELSELHVNYESAPVYPLVYRVTPGKELSPYVRRMRFLDGGRSVWVNESLTLTGIPQRAHEYRLGDKSALGWVVDQYRYTFDSRTNLVSDPNRKDNPWYIVRLIGRIVTVSLETVRIVGELGKIPLFPVEASE